MFELKSIGVIRCAIVLAVLYALGGLLEGLIFASMAVVAPRTAEIPWGGVAGAAMIVVFPIAGAALGFVGGLIGAFLYNLIAGLTGGFVFHLAQLGPIESQRANMSGSA